LTFASELKPEALLPACSLGEVEGGTVLDLPGTFKVMTTKVRAFAPRI
jgi:hypothetical protein